MAKLDDPYTSHVAKGVRPTPELLEAMRQYFLPAKRSIDALLQEDAPDAVGQG